VKIATTGYTKDGNVFFRNQKQVSKDILQSGWTEFEVTIEKKKKKRSIQVNRYYWGVVVSSVRDAFRELGNEVDSELTHEFLKGRFHYTEFIDTKTGECIKLPKTTTEMSNSEFSEYIERIKVFASEVLNIYIPDAGEQTELPMLEHLK
jgi:hypothetical protein